MKIPVVMSWSGGKDSAVALHELLKAGQCEVVALLTTVSEEFRRISTNEVYEAIMERAMTAYRTRGVLTVAFGDLFLQDLREWREANLAKVGMRGLFPIWHRDTAELAREVIGSGYKAYLSCVEGTVGPGFAGRPYDAKLLDDLPSGIDPCGENGEFHSFVYDGPIFRKPVELQVGEIVVRDGRYYADLLPRGSNSSGKCVAEQMPPV
jgi:diphthamide synthase (EF-2-diphthine--ammonia ligase)